MQQLPKSLNRKIPKCPRLPFLCELPNGGRNLWSVLGAVYLHFIMRSKRSVRHPSEAAASNLRQIQAQQQRLSFSLSWAAPAFFSFLPHVLLLRNTRSRDYHRMLVKLRTHSQIGRMLRPNPLLTSDIVFHIGRRPFCSGVRIPSERLHSVRSFTRLYPQCTVSHTPTRDGDTAPQKNK